MPNQDSTLTLSYQINKATSAQALKTIQDLRAANRDLAADVKRLDITTSGLSNSYGKFSQSAISQRNELLKNKAAFTDQISVIDRYKKSLAEANSPGPGGGGGGSTPRFGRPITGIGSLLSSAGASDIGGPLSQIGKATSVFQEMQGVLGDLIPAEEGAAAGSIGMTAALGPLAIVAGVVAVGVVALNAAMEEGRKRTQERIDVENQIASVLANGSATQIKAAQATAIEDAKTAQLKIQMAKDTQAAVEKQIAAEQNRPLDDVDKLLAKLTNQEGYKDATDAVDAAQKEFNVASDKANALTDALRRGTGAMEDAKQAALDYAGTFSKGPTIASQIESAQQSEKQTLAQMQQQRDAEQQAETDAIARGAEQRLAIIQREQDGEAKALLDLQRANADIDKKLEQQKTDDRAAFARNEEKEAKAHADRLRQIQEDLGNSEIDDIENRDFAKLAVDRRAAAQKTEDENRSYAESKQQRKIDLKNKLADDDLAAKRERAQRLQTYNQQIADLRAAEQKDLAANDAATKASLKQLQNKLDSQLKIEEAGYEKLLNQEAGLWTIYNQLIAGQISAAQAQLQDSILQGASGYGKTITYNPDGTKTPTSIEHHYAVGGSILAGQRGLINDAFPGQRETFNGRMLPGGLGWFTPARSGRISPAGGGGVNMPISISGLGLTRRQVADQAAKQIYEALNGLVE